MYADVLVFRSTFDAIQGVDGIECLRFIVVGGSRSGAQLMLQGVCFLSPDPIRTR